MPRHLVILGSGVIGLCTAHFALKRGLRVTVIDRKPSTRDGCSFGNAGMIVPSHFTPLAAPGMVKLGLKMMWNAKSPFYIKPRLSWDLLAWMARFWKACTKKHVERASPLLRDLNLASRSLYEELADESHNAFGLVKQGLLMLCKTPRVMEEESHAAEKANKLGVPAQVLDASATAKLDPNITMDILGSIYFPRDCHLSPNRFMASMQANLEQAGCDFIWETEATGFITQDRKVTHVKTSRGDIACDDLVIAGGAWSPPLGRMLNLKLPMQAGKGYSLTLKEPRELPSLCSICTEARLAITPMGTSLRVGGTMEIAGVNEKVSPRRVQGIIESMPRYFPNFQPEDFSGIQPWVGLRPCTPDGLPYLGRTQRWDNVVIATGHAMMGLSLAPVTGRIVSQVLMNETPEYDMPILSPDRYG
ncbi:MAG: FAD-dependent oxidoreductase [Phycisphaeraceae bacterium]